MNWRRYIGGLLSISKVHSYRHISSRAIQQVSLTSQSFKLLPSPFRSYSYNRPTAFRMSTTANEVKSNPLLQDWNTHEFGLPPFATAKPSDFEQALTESMHQQILELQVLASNTQPADFDNTIAAFDRSGALFQQVMNMFDNLCSSNGVPELQAVELKMAGPLAAHQNKISSLPGLFERIDAVHQARNQLDLTAEQVRLVERFHLDFVRAGITSLFFCVFFRCRFTSYHPLLGAKFTPEDQAKYALITEKLAELCTVFTQVRTIKNFHFARNFHTNCVFPFPTAYLFH